MEQELPPGFVFKPTNEELVNYFLRRRIVNGLSAADCLIKEFNVYTTEPWNLPCDSFRYQDKDDDMFFFTPRRRTSQNSRRADRTAGKGFWDGNGKDELIRIGSDQIIGHKTSLNYKKYGGDQKIKTDWIMHEFRLHSPSNANHFHDLVLCRIHLKKKKENGNKGTYDNVVDVGEEEQRRKVMRIRVEDGCGLEMETNGAQNASLLLSSPPPSSCDPDLDELSQLIDTDGVEEEELAQLLQ